MDGEKYRLTITVKEIKGNCPAFKPGDKIIVESLKVIVDIKMQEVWNNIHSTVRNNRNASGNLAVLLVDTNNLANSSKQKPRT